eukprot:TRINITY_DN19735_c0_g1_i8.p1 TRINITY_DN19735_c0_g1~~TRINITY_DN19735_c0_g1_i8.p1  ORF type:complete len:104 (+),score=26.50 TRINITY_DN19735_c0_g1_i8:148-459(+)
MIRRPPRSTLSSSSAASDVYKRQLMVLITALTNLSAIPALMLLRRRRWWFELWGGGFTMVTSFLYHTADSLGHPILGLTEGEWHRLDNVASCLLYTSPSPRDS